MEFQVTPREANRERVQTKWPLGIRGWVGSETMDFELEGQGLRFHLFTDYYGFKNPVPMIQKCTVDLIRTLWRARDGSRVMLNMSQVLGPIGDQRGNL